MTRLTPEETKPFIHRRRVGIGDVTVEEVDVDIDGIQSALLSKLSGMKREDLREEVKGEILHFWDGMYNTDGMNLDEQAEFRTDKVLSLISPWLAVKIEEARKEGERFAAEAIGQALCNLIGFTMLEDDEAGKRLGQQLAPTITNIQAMAGIRQGKALGKKK